MAKSAHESHELAALRKSSEDYAHQSTSLSQSLADAEAFFASLPGKVEVSIASDDRNTRLAFKKHGALGWRLVIEYTEGNQWRDAVVTSAGISLKVRAAKLLPKLYHHLAGHFEAVNEEISGGLKSLVNLPFYIDRTQSNSGGPGGEQ